MLAGFEQLPDVRSCPALVHGFAVIVEQPTLPAALWPGDDDSFFGTMVFRLGEADR